MQGETPNYFGPEPNWAYSPLPDIDPATGDVVPGTGIRKFVDSMAGLTVAGENNLGQYIPVAIPDTTTYPGSDYYEIELGEYTEQMHSDLNPTTLRGYRQTNTTDPTVSQFHNLGPMIVAAEDRPVRVKFTNSLPIGEGGDLFLPVDTTVMGSGVGPNMATPVTADRVGGAGATVEITTIGPHIFNGGEKILLQGFTPAAYNGEFRVGLVTDATHFQITLTEDPGGPATGLGEIAEMYTDNRGLLHLHGGLTPWISDGTPHQWITPAGEFTNYDRGVSAMNVPDMPDPGGDSMTYFWPNQQSSRLMFYHDHSFGITRLGVYAGGAAGYLLTDFVEQDLIARGIIPSAHIPLIVQDKSFIDPTTILEEDPTWPLALDDELSNLWFPHVYMPNQNPNIMDAVNQLGRWDYGPWIWPPFPVEHEPIESPDGSLGFGLDGLPDVRPNLPDISVGMESYFDTPVVNGTIYPYLDVQPQPYRFSILNAANDRFFNLQIVQADPTGFQVTDANGDTWGTEVSMVPFCSDQPNGDPWPADWPTPDLRDGGIPDPTKLGPDIIQIGNEGGFLPAPVVFNNIPLGYDMDSMSTTVGNVLEHNVFLGNAERADVIIDFSQFAGQTLILYNDAPAAVPGNDPRYDYYTDNPDMTHMGGNVSTIPGFGPNTRTVMQIRVADTTPAAPFDLAALQTEFITTRDAGGNVLHEGVFIRNQDPLIVPQAGYNEAYGVTDFPDLSMAYERIQSLSLTFKPLDLSTPALGDLVSTPVTIVNNPKAIVEEWSPVWGRMESYLGVERTYQNNLNQTSLWFGYKDPVTEIFNNTPDPLMTPIGSLEDGTQLWKITHNGVDTHPIHFHLFNVQVINRVDWAGVVKPPEPNELGWKETVRMNPLEDIIIAMRPTAPLQPFGVPDSIRLLNPTQPEGSTLGFVPFDDFGQPVTTMNEYHNFGWEYVWHCHILSHEEKDMMRPIQVNVARELPAAPGLGWALNGTQVDLLWTDGTPVSDPTTMGNPANEVGYRIERARIKANGQPAAYVEIGTTPANKTDFTDTTADPILGYSYRVVAFNAAGESTSNAVRTEFVAPTLTIDQAAGQADPTIAQPILFTVVFSEEVTGFDATDVVLSGSALATTAVVSTSDNITFAVEVSGMSQEGTVLAGVAAGAANDLAGNPSAASTSTDNSVFFYTGPVPQPVPYSQDFSGDAPRAAEGWEYYATGRGRIKLTSKGRLRMDKRPTTNLEYALNEATLHVNLVGQSNVELGVDHRTFQDEADVYAGTEFTGHVNADLIAVSVDGTHWVKVTDLHATSIGQTFPLDALVQQAAQAAGSADLSNVRIKFQQYGSEPWNAGGRKFDNILVTTSPPAPLMAARSRTPARTRGVLSEAALEQVVTAALADWSGMGLAPEVMNRLQSVQYVIMDLPGATLALAAQDTIYLDRDAAGNGWFVDSTPTRNEEFRVRNRDGQLRAVDRRMARRIDLKTAVLHELGHVAGLSDMDELAADLMNSRLPTGVRRSVWDASVDKVFESGSLWVRRNGR